VDADVAEKEEEVLNERPEERLVTENTTWETGREADAASWVPGANVAAEAVPAAPPVRPAWGPVPQPPPAETFLSEKVQRMFNVAEQRIRVRRGRSPRTLHAADGSPPNSRAQQCSSPETFADNILVLSAT
jgi:hypothetical protein